MIWCRKRLKKHLTTHHVHPTTYQPTTDQPTTDQPTTLDDNSLSLLGAREPSILKLNMIVY